MYIMLYQTDSVMLCWWSNTVVCW